MAAESPASPQPDRLSQTSRVMRIAGSLSEPGIDVRLEDDSPLHLPAKALQIRLPNGQLRAYRGEALRELGVRIGSPIEVVRRPSGFMMGIIGGVALRQKEGFLSRLRNAINFRAS